jgi:hypothetical protein
MWKDKNNSRKKKQVVFLERQNHYFTIEMNSKLSLGAQCFYLPLCVCVDVLYTYMTDSEHLDLVVSQVRGNVGLEDMSDS